MEIGEFFRVYSYSVYVFIYFFMFVYVSVGRVVFFLEIR